MKGETKKLLLLGLIISLCLPIAVYAISIGGAETQGKGNSAIGLDQEFIFGRNIKPESRAFEENVSGIEFNGSLTTEPDINKLNRTMFKAIYGLLDNWDVYVKLGMAGGESKQKYSGALDWDLDWGYYGIAQGQATLSGTGRYRIKNAPAYGFGMKGNYELRNDYFFGIDIQYLAHRNDYKAAVSAIYTNIDCGNPLLVNYSWKDKLTIQEWQVAPYIGKKIGSFTPYLGVKYSDLRIKDKGEGMEYKADDNFGVFVGTGYKLNDRLSLNVEGRFIDETAMSFGATYRF